MQKKLMQLALQLEELEVRLSQPETYADSDLLARLTKKQKELTPVVEAYHRCEALRKELESLEELMSDPDCRDMAKEEYGPVREELERCEEELHIMLLPKDPMDEKNVVMEIRAGVGGEESALFAHSLFRMYSMYAEKQGWNIELAQVNQTELGGLKEVSFLLEGDGVYSRMKHESGVHRVQRVPETESGGRIHTSTVTVAVLPEVDEVEFALNPAELRIDTFRASGAGGQHINKTESAVRITHIPTGTVVECQDQRSQHKNRDRAMSVMRSRLYEKAVEEQRDQIAGQRRSQVGSGMRNERIRTYNFPQGRVTDHRIGLTLYKIDSVMNGELDEIIEALRMDEQMRRREEANSAASTEGETT